MDVINKNKMKLLRSIKCYVFVCVNSRLLKTKLIRQCLICSMTLEPPCHQLNWCQIYFTLSPTCYYFITSEAGIKLSIIGPRRLMEPLILSSLHPYPSLFRLVLNVCNWHWRLYLLCLKNTTPWQIYYVYIYSKYIM